MVKISDSFWTDDRQAAERLTGCLINYGDDTVFVDEIEDGHAVVRKTDEWHEGFKQHRYSLSDPKFNKFRALPQLGWRNIVVPSQRKGRKPKVVGACYVKRTAQRTRSHGLNSNNCLVFDFLAGSLRRSAEVSVETSFCKGVKEDMANPPSFTDAYNAMSNNTSVALSAKWALYRDDDGLTWLYRKTKRIAIILDNVTVSILPTCLFYIEDAQNDRVFRNIEIRGL